MTDSQIQIRISSGRKEQWKKQMSEDPEYRTLTDLIIVAVENELRDDSGDVPVDVDIEPVHNRLDRLVERVREMDDTIDETYLLLRDDRLGGGQTVMARIQELVPEGNRETILAKTPDDSAAETAAEELTNVVEETGSVSHLVRLLQTEGHGPFEVKVAIEQLAEDTATIEATYARPQEHADKRVYRVVD